MQHLYLTLCHSLYSKCTYFCLMWQSLRLYFIFSTLLSHVSHLSDHFFIFSTPFTLPYLLFLNHYFVIFRFKFLEWKNIRLNLFLIHLFHKTLLNTKMEDLLNIKHKIITLYIYIKGNHSPMSELFTFFTNFFLFNQFC